MEMFDDTEYVTFETAKLLKEKGFDKPCDRIWLTESKGNDWKKPERNSEIPEGCNDCTCPTIYQVITWLMDKKDIFLEIGVDRMIEGYTWALYVNSTGEIYPYDGVEETYPMAAEEGIKCALKNIEDK